MTEKSSASPWPNYPVPMKFYGAWDVDKTPANCTPRLCTLTITKLTLEKPLRPDFSSVMVAVKMESSKRTLRSNEIIVPKESQESTLDVELDLTFSLQYPHFLKKGGNQLQILLQRRKRYKNRAILGFKTLAVGVVSMAEVLQRSNCMEKQLELRGQLKELGKNEVVAHVTVSTIKSQPIDPGEGTGNRRQAKLPSFNRSAEVDSEEEVDEYTSNEDASDSEAVDEGAGASSGNPAASPHERLRQANTRKARKLFSRSMGSDTLENGNAQQRNLKQKFIALLKKFRIPDSDVFEGDEQYREAFEQELWKEAAAQNDEDDFFDEDLEDIRDLDYSDSGQEFDEISISSTPKPHLKPFFSSCTITGQETESAEVNGVKRMEGEGNLDFLGSEQTSDTLDTSLKQGGGLDEQTPSSIHNTRKKFFNSIINRYRKPHV